MTLGDAVSSAAAVVAGGDGGDAGPGGCAGELGRHRFGFGDYSQYAGGQLPAALERLGNVLCSATNGDGTDDALKPPAMPQCWPSLAMHSQKVVGEPRRACVCRAEPGQQVKSSYPVLVF